MAAKDTLSFIRILSSCNELESMKVDLTKACPTSSIFDRSDQHEKWLKDSLGILTRGGDTGSFNWEHSRLVSLFADTLGKDSGEWRADYVMLACQNHKETSLPRNTFLENICGKAVYGDAYIFQTKKEPLIGGRTKYYNLGDDFIAAVGEGGYATVILKGLLDQLDAPEVVQEDID